MLEAVDLKESISKEQYKKEAEKCKTELSSLQQVLKEQKIPVIVLFEGWGAAGKGNHIAHMILTLDPRGFKVYSITEADTAEQRKPLLWRYWTKIPAQGQMSFFDRSWYQDTTIGRIEQGMPQEEWVRRINSINTFERQLTDDGYLIVKFFLHINQKEQKKRLTKLADSQNTSWRVTEKDWKRNRHYDTYYKVFDSVLQYTHTENAPWHIIAGNDKYSSLLETQHILIDSIKDAITRKQQAAAAQCAAITSTEDIILSPKFKLLDMPKLCDIQLNKSLTDEVYNELLDQAQRKLKKLHNRLYLEKIPLIIGYEGWDAAGKGGNIRRVAAALDPRGYEVIPIAAPDKYESAHHYLWRFWNNLPKTGHMAIFDRTWYGRVMVERIEGFCTPAQWQRAYQEINEFERELYDWGAIIVKFWLHIDSDEQLRRFKDRQNTPAKQWKITEEDWRNRDKWPQYEETADDMLQYTSTDFAPWHIVESQCKKYARIRTLNILIDAIEEKLQS